MADQTKIRQSPGAQIAQKYDDDTTNYVVKNDIQFYRPKSDPLLSEIYEAIDKSDVTVDQFDRLINESLPKSTSERVLRRARLKPGEPLRPTASSPVKKAEKSVARKGNNDPTKTARGRRVVKDRGEENKRDSEKFAAYAEAVQYISSHNREDTLDEGALSGVSDKGSLRRLVGALLGQPNLPLNREWLHQVREALDGRRGS